MEIWQKDRESTLGTRNLVVWQDLKFIEFFFKYQVLWNINYLLTFVQQDRPKIGGILKSEDSLTTVFLSSEKPFVLKSTGKESGCSLVRVINTQELYTEIIVKCRASLTLKCIRKKKVLYPMLTSFI